MAKISRKITVCKTRIKVSIRDFGLGYTLFRMLTGALRKVFQLRKYIIYVKQLSSVEPPKICNPDIFTNSLMGLYEALVPGKDIA